MAAGAISAAVYYAFFAGGYALLGDHLFSRAAVSADVVAVLANLATAVVVYPLYRRHVFGWDGAWLRGFPRFYVITLSGLVWALIGLPVLIEIVGLPALVALAIIIAALPLLNYQFLRLWTFRAGPRRRGRRST